MLGVPRVEYLLKDIEYDMSLKQYERWNTNWKNEFAKQARLSQKNFLAIGKMFLGTINLLKLRLVLEKVNLFSEKHKVSQSIIIEMRRQRVLKIQSKIDRKKIENVRVIYANAKKDLAKLFFENSIDTFYVHFPDPWPKKKHAVRRLFEKTFLQDIIHRTKDFGKIYLTTDVDYYAEDVGEFFSSLKTCKKLYFHKNDFESPEHSTIHEWKFKQWGRDIYYFCYQKVID